MLYTCSAPSHGLVGAALSACLSFLETPNTCLVTATFNHLLSFKSSFTLSLWRVYYKSSLGRSLAEGKAAAGCDVSSGNKDVQVFPPCRGIRFQPKRSNREVPKKYFLYFNRAVNCSAIVLSAGATMILHICCSVLVASLKMVRFKMLLLKFMKAVLHQ